MTKEKTTKDKPAPKCADNAALEAGMAAVVERVEALEAKQAEIVDATAFVRDEARGLFGLTPIALIFDAIYKKLSS